MCASYIRILALYIYIFSYAYINAKTLITHFLVILSLNYSQKELKKS